MTAPDSVLRSIVQGTDDYRRNLQRLARRGETDRERVDATVHEVLSAVRREGDPAVHRFVEQFEQRRVETLLSRDYGGEQALHSLDPLLSEALQFSAERIRAYHQRQLDHLGRFEYIEDGVTLGSRITPLDRVAVYAPGGKARYPSSVLMSAVIAKVAGVRELIVASPDCSNEVRAACHLAGVTGLLDCGGAQAVAAVAYGTQTVPRVDKIVGPGNVYVTAAKRQVFGEVDIDGIAGPSEILVLADDTADPVIVAADLLSQAEHDEAAYPLLVSTSRSLVDAVGDELGRQLAELPRRSIAEASVRNNGVALIVEDAGELVRVANELATEHVALHTRASRELADRITRAGALFVGAATPEAAGDYVAGPSHVLPTGGAARFGAPLGVYDFVSRSSLIAYEPRALQSHSGHITTIARAEGLEAHARAVEKRLERS